MMILLASVLLVAVLAMIAEAVNQIGADIGRWGDE